MSRTKQRKFTINKQSGGFEKKSRIEYETANPLIYLSSLLLFVAAYYRIHYGIDFSDEGQAVGWSYAPLIGFKPFVNEMFFQQTATLLFTPFVYVYHKLMGNEGIVLFGRHMFMLFSLGACFCVYLFSKKFMSKSFAVLVAMTNYAFIPFAFPVMYYNNIAHLCFLAALFLGAVASMETSKKKFFYTGILLGLVVFAYPTLTIAAGVFYIGIYLYLKDKDVRQKPLLTSLTLGAFIPCFSGALLLLSFGIENLKNSMEFSKTFNALGGWEKIGLVLKSYIEWFPAFWKILALVALGLIGHTLRRFSFLWVFVLFPVIIVTDSNGSPFFPKSHYLGIFYFSAVAPLFLYFSLKKIPLGIWAFLIPVSLAGGLVMGWSSGNGLPNAAIGFWPGVIAGIIFLALRIQNHKNRFQFGGKQAGLFVFLICLSIGVSVLYSNYTFVYRDDSIPEMDTRVKGGPFAGIITTGQRAEFIREVQEDVDEFSKGKESILFFDHFPSGYLFGELKPMSKSLFMHPSPHRRQIFIEFYSDEENLPDIVFELYGVRFGREKYVVFNPPNQTSRKDPFRVFFAKLAEREYQIVKQRQLYRIWARK